MTEYAVIAVFIFAAALLYSSVGHGGASGYLAVMALFSIAPATMRPTALILNICVSSIAAFKFARKGFFSWQKFYPFAIASIPFAFIGGTLDLHANYFRPVLGIVLAAAAISVARPSGTRDPEDLVPAASDLPIALVCGAALGLLAGLTGVGGGIFLSPLLLFMKWTDIRQTAAISAMFILVNSIAGLSANLIQTDLSVLLPWYVFFVFGAAAVLGGTIGATFGSNRHQSGLTLRRLLALVLVIAALKLIFA